MLGKVEPPDRVQVECDELRKNAARISPTTNVEESAQSLSNTQISSRMTVVTHVSASVASPPIPDAAETTDVISLSSTFLNEPRICARLLSNHSSGGLGNGCVDGVLLG